jgi:diguanylate cyclase (GGDEF)-like protein
VSSSVSASLALEPQVFIGRSLDEIFPRDDVADITTRLCKGPENARGFKDVGCIVTVPDGGRHYLRLNGIPVVEGMQFLGYRGTTRDVTKAKRDEQQLILLANQDQLTGLANRRRFLIDLAHEVRRAESIKRTGVLMLIDLDHLKLVNDSAGHSLGDQIIIQVAGNLARLCRTEDLVARVSGDEFAVAFPDMTEAQARDKATQVLAAVDAVRAVHQGQTVNITASIGIVQFPQHGRDAADLMAKVDAAMFAAKAGGRGCAAFFDEQKMARERIGTQLAWKSMLIEALADDSLALVFQPIAAVVDGTVHHHETLVRMRDERGVLVSPDNFIPLAEQFGLIGRIDRAVIRKALRHLAALPERYRDSGIAINLSGLSVGQSDVLHFIESELEDSGVAPARVTFEVTETAACENLNDAIEFISRIRQLGCKVSLDDFGVGFSSFSYLKHLKVDTLKIDGSFIRDIASNRDDQILVKALVDVARGLGIATIAEFVESEQAFEIIRRLGVDYVQGYFVGKPVPDLSVRRIELPASKAQAFDRQATGS